MKLKFTIRNAELYDKEAMKEICRVSFRSLYRYFAIRSLNSIDQVLVSGIKGIVVGFAKLRIVHIYNDTLGNILWLAVHPKFRQKGIASALIDASIDYFKNHGINTIHVSVRKSNLPALNLFQRKGFKKVGFRELIKLYRYQIIKFYLKMYIAPKEIVLVKSI